MRSPSASPPIELEVGRIRELGKGGRHSEALAAAETLAAAGPPNRDVLYLIDSLLRLEPGNSYYLSLCAAACVGLGEHEPAIALYRQLLAASPRSRELYVSLGHALQTVRTTEGVNRILPNGGDYQAKLRRCLVESRQSQDLSIFGERDRTNARRGSRAGRKPGRSLSSVLRTR